MQDRERKRQGALREPDSVVDLWTVQARGSFLSLDLFGIGVSRLTRYFCPTAFTAHEVGRKFREKDGRVRILMSTAAKKSTWLAQAFGLGALCVSLMSCATQELVAPPVLPKEPPAYVRVPHPQGMDQGDLEAIFKEASAPDLALIEGCRAQLEQLRAKTQARDELFQGAREIVRKDPVRQHWCFYSGMRELERELSSKIYVDERQRIVMDQFLYLTPVARAFQLEFGDTRYLRWAVSRYRKLSELVFYRRVELSPEGVAMLGPQIVNPWGAFRKGEYAREPETVLEKYGIASPSEVPPAQKSEKIQPVAPETRAPASPPAGADPAPAPLESLPEPPAPPAESARSLPPGTEPALEPGASSQPDLPLLEDLLPPETPPAVLTAPVPAT